MLNKVVFVEDEIVTREGIRDHVDWQGNGFELCGEAPDGEMALQLLQTALCGFVVQSRGRLRKTLKRTPLRWQC